MYEKGRLNVGRFTLTGVGKRFNDDKQATMKKSGRLVSGRESTLKDWNRNKSAV